MLGRIALKPCASRQVAGVMSLSQESIVLAAPGSQRLNFDSPLRFAKWRIAGHRFDELGKEFGVTPWSIWQWVKRADRDAGTSDGCLTSTEREELIRKCVGTAHG